MVNKKSIIPITLLLISTGICFSVSSCDDPTCCEMYSNGPDFEYARQMCHNSMLFDDKYDVQNGCFLKEVDRYIEAAENCCAPLGSAIDYEFISITDLAEDNPLVSVVAKVAYARNPNYSGSYISANAYTHCLFETNPRTYQCNIDKAKQFGDDLNQCCGTLDGNERIDCITDFISKQKCEKKCCTGLPEEDNDNYISKTHCEQLLKRSNECIETTMDACCRIAPIDPSRGHIDRNICKQIYTESNGSQCVNTDEKYEIYKKN